MEAYRIIDEYGDFIGRICRRYCKDSSLMEDAVQDTVLTILRKWHQFRHSSKESTYVYAIARSRSLMLLRREKKFHLEVSTPYHRLDRVANVSDENRWYRGLEVKSHLLECARLALMYKADGFSHLMYRIKSGKTIKGTGSAKIKSQIHRYRLLLKDIFMEGEPWKNFDSIM